MRRGTAPLALVIVLVATACSSTNQRADRAFEPISDEPGSTEAGAGSKAGHKERPRVSGDRGTRPNASGPGGITGDPNAPLPSGAAPAPLRGTIKVGVRYLDAGSTKTAGEVFGLSGADVGDPRKYAEVLLKHVNENGGLAGRKAEGVYHGVDAVELAVNSAAAEEKACRALTEDAKVLAIVSPGPTNQAFPDCTVKKKVPVVNVSYNYYPTSAMKRYGPYFYFPTSMDSDRSHRTFVDALIDQGFFPSGHKLGLVRMNTTTHEQVLTESVKPALARHGLRIHEEAAVRNAQDQEGYASAVLRFRQRGITNVIFIESAGQIALYFTQRAEDQGYRPRYGFSSHASLLGIALNTPTEQLRGSVGVGWIPATDAVGPKGVELGPDGKRCLDLVRSYGAKVETEGAVAVALWTCDVVLFLKAGLDRAPTLGPSGLAKGAAKIGTAFRPAGTFATSFPPGRRDGASLVRKLAYDVACRCFRWRGPAYPTD